jgi:hypothetical protein
MCIAILNTPQGGTISEDTLWKCWSYNNDGAGFAFPKEGKLVIEKELNSFKRFFKRYVRERQRHPDQNFMLHFRIKTHGLVSKSNVHPFLIHEELAFVHNGMVDGFHDPTKSDTVLFMEKVLRTMPKDFINHEGIRRLIRKSTGWSKFIFLQADGAYRIINEEGGVWDEGNWYSNTTYRPYEKTIDVGGRTQVYTGNGFGVSEPVIDSYWQTKYGTGTFKKDGTPTETYTKIKTIKELEQEAWAEKQYAEYNYNDSSIAQETEDDLPFRAPEKKDARCCSECYTELAGRMENHYGVCTKCLKEYEIIPDKS